MKKTLLIFTFLLLTTTVFAQSTTTENNIFSGLNAEDLGLLQNSLNIIQQTGIGSDGINPSTGLPLGIDEQISVNTFPEVPEPGEDFTVILESYSTDLYSSNITWTVNNEVVLQGVGETEITITTPSAGQNLTISFNIQKSNGGVIGETISFTPSEVDIVYEANTYTPPFYKGKAVFTREALLEFVAIPEIYTSSGQLIPNEDLVFVWKINYQVVADASGTGKNIFEYQGKLLQKPIVVTVDVRSTTNDSVATKSIEIANTEPQVLIYEKNPLLGTVFERAVLGNFVLNREEIELQAVPYFFTANGPTDARLEYDWNVNGRNIILAPNEDSVVFRNESESTGRSNIGVSVNNLERILQSSRTGLSLEIISGLIDFEF